MMVRGGSGCRAATVLAVLLLGSGCPGPSPTCNIGDTSCLGIPCDEGHLVCGAPNTICSNVGTDRMNCGSCGNACDSGEFCDEGECVVCSIECEGALVVDIDSCTCVCPSPAFTICGGTSECCAGSCCDGICCAQGTVCCAGPGGTHQCGSQCETPDGGQCAPGEVACWDQYGGCCEVGNECGVDFRGPTCVPIPGGTTGGTATDSVAATTAEVPEQTAVTPKPTLNGFCQELVDGESRLWSPDHKVVRLSLDDCFDSDLPLDRYASIVAVTSDELADDRADGNTCDDAVIETNSSIALRAERRGDGDGRVYTVIALVRVSEQTYYPLRFQVAVPLEPHRVAVDSGERYCIGPGCRRYPGSVCR
jgi:hypothetical protein